MYITILAVASRSGLFISESEIVIEIFQLRCIIEI